jgi:hypothetical protein
LSVSSSDAAAVELAAVVLAAGFAAEAGCAEVELLAGVAALEAAGGDAGAG